jgi:AAA+ ATPase superfamily predicted ATPase
VGFTLRPVSGTQFVGRDKQVLELVATLKNPSSQKGFAIIGSKNLGKTSLVKQAIHKLTPEKEIVKIYFSLDCLTDNSQHNFIRKLSKTILESYKQILGLTINIDELYQAPLGILDTLLRGMNLDGELLDSVKLLLTFEREKEVDMNSLFKSLFDLPDQLAKETDTSCLLFFDEFGDILKLKNGFDSEDILKILKESHAGYENTLLNITLSNLVIAQKLIIDDSSLFSDVFFVMSVKPFDLETGQKLVEKNLGMKLSDEVYQKIHLVTQGVPFYLQFLGRKLNCVGDLNLDKFNLVFDEFLEEECTIIFREKLNRLSNKERMILVCMVKHDLNTPSAISKELNYSQTNVRRFLSILEEKEIIVNEERGKFEIEDNIFKQWLKQQVQ